MFSLCIFLLQQESWRSCLFFLAPNRADDNDFIDILADVVSTGLRKLFSVITYEELMKDVSWLFLHHNSTIIKPVTYKEIFFFNFHVAVFICLCVWEKSSSFSLSCPLLHCNYWLYKKSYWTVELTRKNSTVYPIHTTTIILLIALLQNIYINIYKKTEY